MWQSEPFPVAVVVAPQLWGFVASLTLETWAGWPVLAGVARVGYEDVCNSTPRF